MDPGSELKLCTNCKRDIAAANFVMHEVHCHRNIILCKICNEPIPRSEHESHNAEFHVQVQCPKCRLSVERVELPQHDLEKCPKRIVRCTYCTVEHSHDALTEHEGYCGTRTEQCPLCGTYVMIKDQTLHDDTMCQYPDTSTSNVTDGVRNGANSPEVIRLNAFAMDELDRIVDLPMIRNDVYGRQKNAQMWKSDKNERAERINNYTIPGAAALLIPDDDNEETMLPAQRSQTHEYFDGGFNFAAMRSKTRLPCEFCDSLLPSDDLILHQSACPGQLVTDSASREDADAYRDVDSGRFGDDYAETQQWISTAFPVEFTSSDDVMLPCEFCDEAFPSEILIQHQAVCDLNGTQTPRPPPHARRHPTSPSDDATSHRSNRRQQDPNVFHPQSPRPPKIAPKENIGGGDRVSAKAFHKLDSTPASSLPAVTSPTRTPSNIAVNERTQTRHRPAAANVSKLDTIPKNASLRRLSDDKSSAGVDTHEPNFVTRVPRRAPTNPTPGHRNSLTERVIDGESDTSRNPERGPVIQPRSNFKPRTNRKPAK